MSEIEKRESVEQKDAAPAKPAKEKKAKGADKKPGAVARFSKWVRELKSELKKIQWPTTKQTVNNTVIVVVCVLVVGVFIWGFDALATAIINALLHLAGK